MPATTRTRAAHEGAIGDLRVFQQSMVELEERLAAQMEERLAAQRAELEGRLADQDRQRAAEREVLEGRLTAQQAEIERLRALRGEAQAAPPILPARRPGRGAADAGRARPEGATGRPSSRRGLLKLGGAAAVAGVAAGAGELLRPGVARANGVQWLAGVVNSDNQTFVEPQNGSFPDPTLLTVRLGTGTPYSGLSAANSAAVAVYDTAGAMGLYATSRGGTAVQGLSDSHAGIIGDSGTGIGVTGISSGSDGVQGLTFDATGHGVSAFNNSAMASSIAMLGHSDNGIGGLGPGIGVQGETAGGTGVVGSATTGTGVSGTSASGLGGSFSGGRAPLALGLATTAGHPTAGTHVAGEFYLDLNATVWLCIGGGMPGKWVVLGTPQPGYAGGATNLLPVPIRLLDTRAGAPVGFSLPGAPIPYHGTLQMQASNLTFQGQTIPAGATAVFGNLVVALAPHVNPGDGSSLICWPNGQPRPAAVNIVYNPGDQQGEYTSTFTLVAIGTSNLVNLYSQPINAGVAVDVIFDAFGFVM